jgi:DNA-directed RNA polymerase subunit E"|tara:strand:- start:1200 stop:1382 length:183 start_codon:yes stop_codon:yes gene_type:complete
MAKKACKSCKLLIEGNKCPLCNSDQLSESWKGKLIVLNAEESNIAKKTGIKTKGEYAIKL